MKIIEYLINKIDNELEDAEEYIKKAEYYKEEYPEISNMLYELSKAELSHMERIHISIVTLINEYKREKQEIPKDMKYLYDYIHNKYIEEADDIKLLISKFK